MGLEKYKSYNDTLHVVTWKFTYINMKYAVLLYTKISMIHTAIQKRAKLQFSQQNKTFSVSPFKMFSCFLLRCHKQSSTWIIYIILLYLLKLFSYMSVYWYVMYSWKTYKKYSVANNLSRSYAESAKFVKGLSSGLII